MNEQSIVLTFTVLPQLTTRPVPVTNEAEHDNPAQA